MNEVTVLIPCFNSAGRIGHTLDSISWLSVAPKSVVVVDDGLSDRSADVARLYQSGSLANTVALHTGNNGVAAALSTGLRSITSDMTLVFGADDIIMLQMIEVLSSNLEGMTALVSSVVPNLAIDYGHAPLVVAEDDIQIAQMGPTDLELVEPLAPFRSLLRGMRLPWVALHLTTVLQEYEFKERYRTEDWPMWLRISRHHAVATVDAPLITSRRNDSLSSWSTRTDESDLVEECQIRMDWVGRDDEIDHLIGHQNTPAASRLIERGHRRRTQRALYATRAALTSGNCRRSRTTLAASTILPPTLAAGVARVHGGAPTITAAAT